MNTPAVWLGFGWLFLCVLLTGAFGGRAFGALYARFVGPRVFPSLYGWVGPSKVVFGGMWPWGLLCFFIGHRWDLLTSTGGFWDDEVFVWRECKRCARVEEPARTPSDGTVTNTTEPPP